MSANLNGVVREKLGSRPARYLRLQDRIPASIQGEGKDNINFSIERAAFEAARRHHEHLFDITLDKGDTETGMVRELQWGPLGQELLHVEFVRVVRGRKTEVEVALEFTGHTKGGVLNALATHITISCLPSQIPDSIEVLVGDLEEGSEPLHARDLKLPEGSELAVDPDMLIASVGSASSEDDGVAAEGSEEGDAEATAAAPSEE